MVNKEEVIKYERNGLDCWDEMLKNAAADIFPDEDDMFRYKFYGMFHVKPAQDSFMLRCRVPAGVLTTQQFRGLAEMAEDWGGNYIDLTTRGNLQIREIMPRNVVNVLQKLTDLGLTSKGAGADNVRNVTGNPTSGFDKQELIDVVPLARAMHHCILNNRDLYGMPRKFNISFDSGGAVSTCADTNDIGFYAVEYKGDGDLEPGVYFRVQLCGITGHRQLASDCGLLLKPDECVAVAAAILRVFIEHGDRTNRNKARMKYIIQQSQAGYNYIGVVTPVGRMSPEQMRQMCDLADQYGQSDIRLTAWQNLLIPFIKDEDVSTVLDGIKDSGFSHTTTNISGGLVACTGNVGWRKLN